MALATKCPHCNTIFRVAADQLKLRGGIVRCGSCHEVFDGNAALVEPAPKPTPVIPEVPAVSEPPVAGYVRGSAVDFELDFADDAAPPPTAPPAASPAVAPAAQPAVQPAAGAPAVWRGAALTRPANAAPAPAAPPSPEDIAQAAVARAFAHATAPEVPPATTIPDVQPLPSEEASVHANDVAIAGEDAANAGGEATPSAGDAAPSADESAPSAAPAVALSDDASHAGKGAAAPSDDADTAPSSSDTAPAADNAEPSVAPAAAPSDDASHAGEDAAASDDDAEPSVARAAAPSDDANHAGEDAAASDDDAEPSVAPAAAPSDDASHAGEDAAASDDDAEPSVARAAAPSEDAGHAGEDAAAPANDATHPGGDDAAPAILAAPSSGDTTASADDAEPSAAPAAAPSDDTAVSAEESGPSVATAVDSPDDTGGNGEEAAAPAGEELHSSGDAPPSTDDAPYSGEDLVQAEASPAPNVTAPDPDFVPAFLRARPVETPAQSGAAGEHPDGRIEPTFDAPQEHIVAASLDDAYHFDDQPAAGQPAPPAADEPWSLAPPEAEAAERDETALHAVAAVNADVPDDGASLPDDEAPRADSTRAAADARMRALAGVDETPAEDLDHSDLSFVKRHDRSQKYGKAIKIGMAFGIPLLLGGLVLQAATTFRDTLAATYPQLKPALTAVCQPLGCQVSLPTQLDALSIEQGELASMAENTFSFSTVLRNQSKLVQAWPHIELTLNDNADKPVLRRVFAPREYLPAASEADKGFGPRSEQSIKLYFELKELKASGYHIAIFYP